MDRQPEARGTKERGPSLGWQMVRDEQKGRRQLCMYVLCTIQCGTEAAAAATRRRRVLYIGWTPSVTPVDRPALEGCEPTLVNDFSTQNTINDESCTAITAL
ncbi:hypothetical protein GMOD_00004336 [Pyrenophora seminiperda CCB06]|uniref:Uncharacterized protein n=1 Tax=Pyrenophora seminiperda CCB06 TaxID=1302712 RepID=A0A3M7M0Z9_9PLEO|nr:hypothetical protein GMOD_00004336 [Pyrenophora seminiperda CCB06]